MFNHAREQGMQVANMELVESLHQFITVWRLIGRRFPQVDGYRQAGLAISWPNTPLPLLQFTFSYRAACRMHACCMQDGVQEAAEYMRARPYGGSSSCA
jgi:hypothetical protein